MTGLPLDAERPELSSFEHDLLAFERLWEEAEPALQAAVDAGTNGREALTNVTSDYYVRTYEHGVGAALLLREKRPIPFSAVQRSLYETMITLNYLATHEQAEREAQIALAHQPIHEIWGYRTYGLLDEDVARLNAAKGRLTQLRVDADIYDAARERRASYRWTNKSFASLFEKRGNPHEYHLFYGRMSAVVHPDQRQIAQRMSDLPPEWFEARASECRYFIREVRRLMILALGVPFASEWFDHPSDA